MASGGVDGTGQSVQQEGRQTAMSPDGKDGTGQSVQREGNTAERAQDDRLRRLQVGRMALFSQFSRSRSQVSLYFFR